MKQRQKRPVQGQPQKITKAVTHIRLIEVNSGKLDALDALASVYLTLCQSYISLFCTEVHPDKFHPTVFPTTLSERWHRAVIQHSAGIAQSWRTNREQAYQDYLEDLKEHLKLQERGELDLKVKEPIWVEWDVPSLCQTCIQANTNVIRLEVSEQPGFDYWLRISTLEFRNQLLVPIKLADYHKKVLEGKTINSSVQLNKRDGMWWLTLSYDEIVPIQVEKDASVIGVDVGIANFLTSSDGKTYGTFNNKLAERHKRDREKRRRKAKLRACLEKKGVQKEKLPSTTSQSGQRLARYVRQSINQAINEFYRDHPDYQVAYEQLSVASMRFKSRQMNAYLYASNLAYIPKQLAWNAAKRGIPATPVQSAYSSQECNRCHYVDRANRLDQRTFHCQAPKCNHTCHADENAAQNIAARLGDQELQECRNRIAVKDLLMRRHEAWKKQNGSP